MPCSQWEQLISEYLDGELPREDGERVERHLLECKSCAQFFKNIKADGEAVAEAFDLPRLTTAAFADRVMGAVRHPARRRKRWPWAIATIAASIVVAFLARPPHNIGSVTRIMDRSGARADGGVELFQAEAVADAKMGSAIKRGDIISTSAGRVVFVRLKTGDEIIINHGSLVIFTGPDPDHRGMLDLAGGEAFVRAARGKGTFAVRTRAGTATVLGTQFSVAFDGPGRCTVLTVVEGAVRFHNSHGEKLVTAGQQSVASVEDAPSQPKAVDAHALTAWTDPPSAARLEQIARRLVEDLEARVVPDKDVFEAGEPIYVTVELDNNGAEAVQFSRSLFADREDNAPRRTHHKLSQVMLTKIFGAKLETHAAELPGHKLIELKPGKTWRARLQLTDADAHPALRTIRGPGSYSVAVAFAAGKFVPAAPGDSMVWADVGSESAIVRVVSVRVVSAARPQEDVPVAGLQLDLGAASTWCRVGGDPLALKFSLKGVTSDEIAVSTSGQFRVKIEPVTFGMLTAHVAGSELHGKLGKTLEQLGVEAREVSLRQALDLLHDKCGINVLADVAVLSDTSVKLDPAQTLAENLEHLCTEAGAAMEVGRSALWFFSASEPPSLDAAPELTKLESKEGWVELKAVDSREGELKLTAGGEHLPRPGLYRCTLEYSNKQAKTGPDWPAAWLGSVKASPIMIAVFEPQPPVGRSDKGLSVQLLKAEATSDQDARTIRLEVEFSNTSDEAITLRPSDGLKVRAERLLRDLLNPYCYKEDDAGVAGMFDQRRSLTADAASAADVIGPLFVDLESSAEVDRLKDGRIAARAEGVSAGEMLEFAARMSGVSFMRSGDQTYVMERDRAPSQVTALTPASFSGVGAGGLLTIPAGERFRLTTTITLGEPGRHRLQVQYLRTGVGRGEEGFWTGDAHSNPLTVDVK